MKITSWRCQLVLCTLALLLAFPTCVVSQAPAGIPAEWLQPIGGGTATPTDSASTTPGGATPAGTTPVPTPTPTPTTTPATDPNAGTPITDPNAGTTPAATPDPNAVTTTPVPTPTPTTTDPNAAITTPVLDPTATVTPGVTDPNAAIGGLPLDPMASPTPGALVAGPAPAPTTDIPVVTPDDALTNEDPPPSPVPDNLPPAPPLDWKALPVDTEIIFGLQLDGPYLAPWTKSKSWVFTNVLADRYLRSCDVEDIETGPLETKQYNVPVTTDGSTRRRLLSHSRKTLATDQTTVETSVLLRVKVHTNYIRVESEVRSVVDGVSSGSLAKDLSMALGAPVTNVTLTAQPITQPYDFIEDPNASTGGSLAGWVIGCIVGAVLVLMPIPAYILYKRHKRKHLETVEKQQAEAAAARQRMQSRIIKSGGKSFTNRQGSGVEHDILARTGSMASYGGYQYPSGPESVADGRMDSMTRQGSFINGIPRSPTKGPTPQQQRYQEQSLGPGAMPSPHRIPSYANMGSIGRGAVLPISARGSDGSSTSSGNMSDKRPL